MTRSTKKLSPRCRRRGQHPQRQRRQRRHRQWRGGEQGRSSPPCYLWEDIEISNIEEGRALNSWLIGLVLMLEVILFYELNFTSKERFHAGQKTRFTLSNRSMKLSCSVDEIELIMIDLDMYLKNKYHSTQYVTLPHFGCL